MKHLKVMEIIKKLQADGWYRISSEGGHMQFQHPTKKGKVTVPTSKGEIFGKLLKSIENQAQINF